MTDTVALFADVMGFAAAIEQFSAVDRGGFGLDQFNFNSTSRPPFLPDDPLPSQLAQHKIWSLYTGFHSALQRLQKSEIVDSFDEMIVFSDSAFIITHQWGPLDVIASTLMSECFEQGVPLRIGIARGDFARRPFSTVQYPSGKLVTEAPFLGSSIVRAYRAQSQGCPGFRILVHPSVKDYANTHMFRLPKEDQSAFSVAEVNWLLHGMVYQQLPDLEGLIAKLASMREGILDQRALRHYDATEQSIRRMHSLGWNFDRYERTPPPDE
jgi:hypothetical protein